VCVGNAFPSHCKHLSPSLCLLPFFLRDTQKGVLTSDSYQGKQMSVQEKDSLTHNDVKKIKLH
jgi:hypothetical protein